MATETSSEVDWEGFLTTIRILSADGAHDRLKAVLDSNSSLKEENKTLNASYETNIGQLAKALNDLAAERVKLQDKDAELVQVRQEKDAELMQVRQEKADVEKRLAGLTSTLEEKSEEITKLQTGLKSKDEEIKKLKEALVEEEAHTADAKKLAANAKKELQAAVESTEVLKKDIETKTRRLGGIDRLLIVFKPVESEDMEKQLGLIFRSAYELVKTHLNVNLDETALADSEIWSFDKTRWPLVLPRTNTTTAKQMRIAMVLRVLGYALANYVFQPTCFTAGNEELSRLLSSLAQVDAPREGHIRATLLGADPERQKLVSRNRAKRVTDVVSEYIKGWLPDSKRAAFTEELEKGCDQIYQKWHVLQQAREHIEPVLFATREEMETMDLDFTWFTALPELSESRKPLTNGNGAAPSRGSGSSGSSKQTGTQPSHSSDSIIGVPAYTVWPGFATATDGDVQIVRKAVVLTKAQVNDARDELNSRRTKTDRRRMSMSVALEKHSSPQDFLGGGARNGKNGG